MWQEYVDVTAIFPRIEVDVYRTESRVPVEGKFRLERSLNGQNMRLFVRIERSKRRTSNTSGRVGLKHLKSRLMTSPRKRDSSDGRRNSV